MRIVSKHTLGRILYDESPVNPRVVTASHAATPWEALAIVNEAFGTYRLCIPNAQKGIPTRPGVQLETIFIGPGMRHHPMRYIPVRLSMAPALFKTTLAPDVVIIHVNYDRKSGTLSLGTEVNILPAAIEAVKERGGLVIAQINEQMPYTYGDGVISTEVVDYAIEVDTPLDAIPEHEPSETEKAIAANVASLVPDGATLMAGVGAIPDTALSLLTGSNYRVWAEMFSTGVLALAKRGALDPSALVVGSFVMGSQELYAWLDHNPHVAMRRTEHVNDPAEIADKRKMVAIVAAMQVDLHAQANASHVNGKPYSGFGGHTDFIVGAMHSKGGMAIIALSSWHAKADVSTIVLKLDNPATSFQHSYVVTENGVATIFGQDERTQARQLISIANPRVRDELTRAHFNDYEAA